MHVVVANVRNCKFVNIELQDLNEHKKMPEHLFLQDFLKCFTGIQGVPQKCTLFLYYLYLQLKFIDFFSFDFYWLLTGTLLIFFPLFPVFQTINPIQQ